MGISEKDQPFRLHQGDLDAVFEQAYLQWVDVREPLRIPAHIDLANIRHCLYNAAQRRRYALHTNLTEDGRLTIMTEASRFNPRVPRHLGDGYQAGKAPIKRPTPLPAQQGTASPLPAQQGTAILQGLQYLFQADQQETPPVQAPSTPKKTAPVFTGTITERLAAAQAFHAAREAGSTEDLESASS